MKRIIRDSVTSSNNAPTKYASSLESSDLKETAYAIANYMSNIDGIVNDNTKRVTIRKSGDGYNIYIGYRFGALLGEYGGKAERNLTILEEKGYDREDVLTDRGITLLQFFESVRQDLMNIHPDVDIRISPVRDGMHGLYGLGISADLVVTVTRIIKDSLTGATNKPKNAVWVKDGQDMKWKIFKGTNNDTVDPDFLSLANKRNHANYIDVIVVPNGKHPNEVINSYSQSEYEYRKNIYLKRKHEFETLGEDDNNDVLSRKEKMDIAKSEMDKVAPKSANSVNVQASNDDYDPYSFMVGDQLEWSGLYGGQYKGVVTDVNDEYITVDVMWTAEDSGQTVLDTQQFEITTDPAGKECIIVWTYGAEAGYVYPPSGDDYIHSADEYGVSGWKEVASKQVVDSDGFLTDYTMYTDGETWIFMFGDKDINEPDRDYADWEADSEDRAWEWFNSYSGFEDDE